jgi:hypothetical protein
MKLNIDTSESMSHNPVSVGDMPREVYYPEFTFKYDEPDAVPDTGTMTIKYRVARRSEDAKRPKDERYSCTIEVTEIVSANKMKDESPSKKYNEAGEALDKLAAEKMMEHEEEED